MIKIIKKSLIISLFFLLLSCGFKKLNDNRELISIESFNITGDKRIGFDIKNQILLISNNDSQNKVKFSLDSKKIKTSKDKNTSGKITRYNIALNIILQIEELNKNDKFIRNFNYNVDYNVGENHSETIDAQKKATQNATDIIVEEIIRFLSLYYR